MLGKYSKPYQGKCIIKKYGTQYKIIQGTFREKGFDIDNKKGSRQENSKKLDNSLSRSRQKIQEYILCNDFDYFCTFTLDKTKYDRFNLDKFIKDFSQYIRDLRKKYKEDIIYLFIPETHKDGAWHLHGFMKLPEQLLSRFNENDKLPKYIKEHIDTLYNWSGYQSKFGYCCLEKIKDKRKVASYATKYVTKTLGSDIEKNKKTYFSSRGLKQAEIIGSYMPTYGKEIEFDYIGEYVSVKWVENKEALFDLGFSDCVIPPGVAL